MSLYPAPASFPHGNEMSHISTYTFVFPAMISFFVSRLRFAVLCTLLLVCGCYSGMAQTSARSVVVKLRPGKPATQFLTSIQTSAVRSAQPLLPPQAVKQQKMGIQSQYAAEMERYIILSVDEGTGTEHLLQQLRERGDVESAELNTLHSLPETGRQKAAATQASDRTAEQWALERIRAAQAWKTSTGAGIIVGVVDTGIDFNHPEFKGQLWINSAEDLNGNGTFEPWPSTETVDGVSGDLNGIDDDGNGYADDVIGYDFVDQQIINFGDSRDRDAIPFDEHGHGTNVSGVIGARNDGAGITGVAYGSKILTLRAFDATGNGEDDDFAAAIVYGAMNGARVINLSFGDVYYPVILRDAIAFANSLGCTVVASSGNNGGTSTHFPSNFNEVIAVGSTSQTDKLSQTSTFGSLVDMVAPGVNILTTDRNASYATLSGTSFSAPHVAAAAALLLAQRPSLSPDEVRNILASSADDLGSKGWDFEFGSGRLNVASALDLMADGAIVITFPSLDYDVDAASTSSMAIVGSVIAPFFSSYTVDFTGNERDTIWQNLASSTKQIRNDTLASLPVGGLKDGVYFLRIRVRQTNGNTLENRQRFSISSATPSFTRILTYNAWLNDRRAVIVSARTTHLTRFSVRFRPQGSSEPFRELTEVDKFTRNHTVVIGDEALPGIPYEAEAIGVKTDGATVRTTFEFRRESTAISWGDIHPLPYSVPQGYLLNATADLHGDGKAAFVVASTEEEGNITRSFTFDGKNFATRDSIPALWIPRGIGDSNGDGIAEVFAQFGARSALFQRSSSSSSPFATRLFSDDTDTSNFWASAMADLDRNGRTDLIARSDSAYMAYTYDGSYRPLVIGRNQPRPDLASVSVTGDFDGDGRNELCYGTSNAGFVILEYRNGVFAQEYSNPNDNFNGNFFIAAPDVDGDGRPEILICTYKDVASNTDREYETPLWSFKLLRSVGPNQYEVAWQDYSYGVRPPNPYKSGVAVGNIDNRPGDECIIIAFPNVFVFTWKEDTLQPFWYFPTALSNTAIIHDFNGNGIQEIGFGTGGATRFFEYDPKALERPGVPTLLTGHALDATTVTLSWNASASAQEYAVFGGKESGQGTLQLMATTTATTVVIPDLASQTSYQFVVVAINNTLPQSQSDPSNDAFVFTHVPARAESIRVINRTALEVTFSNDIPQNPLQPSLFSVSNWGNPSTVIPSGDRTLLLYFAYPLVTGTNTLSIASFRDRYHSPIEAASLAFDVHLSDPAPELYLTAIKIVNPTTLDVSFSEPVEPASAQVAASYTLSPVGSVSVAQVQEDPTVVRLTLDPATPLRALGRNYVLTVTDVASILGHPMTTGPGKALGFTLEAADGNNAYAYPNPVRLDDQGTVFFGNLPNGAVVSVHTLDGVLLATLKETDGNGGVEWNCRDTRGTLIESGVYLFSVQNPGADGTAGDLKKFAVIRR
jgi:subtilisin family serine protease